MEANRISCQTCGGTSFTKTDKIAICEYCGTEYDISQLQAKAAKLEAEQRALNSLADDISRLRQLADQKEAMQKNNIEEEKRKKAEEEKHRQEEQRKQRGLERRRQQNLLEQSYQQQGQQDAEQEASHKSCGCLVLMTIIMLFFGLNEGHSFLFAVSLVATFVLPTITYLILMPDNK